jgi:hypothetical protein
VVASQGKKTFCAVWEPCLLFISYVDLATTDRKGIQHCLPFELVIWWVSAILCSQQDPTVNLAAVNTIQSKSTFGVVDKRPLLRVLPTNLPATERKWLNDSLAIELLISWIPKLTHLLQPSNSTN